MIYGFTHPGSGLGNQLHRYVATRVLALDKGYDFHMIGYHSHFKGKSFMSLDSGKTPIPHPMISLEQGGRIMNRSEIPSWEENTPYYNPEFNFIEDNTIIDGEFQDERYFEHRMKKINEWLEVEYLDVPNDLCVIGFRGGEFYTVPELGLPKSYFEEGIAKMKRINPKMRFEVHTDDVELAQKFFPDYKVIHDIGINWRSMRFAKYAIIANSSFYTLPRLLLGKYGRTIAPRYWDRYNIKKWERPYNFYKSFQYI